MWGFSDRLINARENAESAVATGLQADKQRGMEEFVNHESRASGLRILGVFYQHPKLFISL